ncbi:hypothetical protein N7541_008591 [Penicillium brevicompactum]|uniref:Microbial-type PARG catalytic domain-containing protein n=1 Tax=Penicillium brevicompactum TaxID=5074 RepID=A0A9W9R1L6_PENBR|nr:hypothetical protein N7541_008591 [Penicillium brevicompactum]
MSKSSSSGSGSGSGSGFSFRIGSDQDSPAPARRLPRGLSPTLSETRTAPGLPGVIETGSFFKVPRGTLSSTPSVSVSSQIGEPPSSLRSDLPASGLSYSSSELSGPPSNLPSSLASSGSAFSGIIEPASSLPDTALIEPLFPIMAEASNKTAADPAPQKSPKSAKVGKSGGVDPKVIKETQEHTKTIIAKTAHEGTEFAYSSTPENAPALSQESRMYPAFEETLIQVVEGDTFDIAIEVTNGTYKAKTEDFMPVCVLNHANAFGAGGSWKTGATAQEEQLFYRSTLCGSLREKFYPMKELECLYSPHVIIFRENSAAGFKFLENIETPEKLPVVSVISMAAQRGPKTVKNKEGQREYADDDARGMMYNKMKQILRTAAHNNHRRLVLGALGCGVFGHPEEEVADLWKEGLTEDGEFDGWFEQVILAIFDKDKAKKNLRTFERMFAETEESPLDVD